MHSNLLDYLMGYLNLDLGSLKVIPESSQALVSQELFGGGLQTQSQSCSVAVLATFLMTVTK